MARRRAPENVTAKRGYAVFIGAISALMIGSAGVAIFPDIAQLAAPVVCRGQSLVTTTSDFSRSPGSGGTQTRVDCVDSAGTRTEVGGIFVMLAITLELFVPFATIGWWVSAQVWPAREPGDDEDDG
jgi:hypothetical protein